MIDTLTILMKVYVQCPLNVKLLHESKMMLWMAMDEKTTTVVLQGCYDSK